MDDKLENRGRSGGRRVAIALASCVFGAGLILLASQIGSKSEDGTAETGKDSSAEAQKEAQKKKTHRTWNIALGNVVVVAPDLGLNAKGFKSEQVEESKIATRLESQLQGLREFYRQESERDPTLMGGMLLQLTVSPAGDVTHVKELVSRIADNEFKKAVLGEASKWTFPEIITDSTTITCPILFVREGMDITTIVQWEKTLGQFSEKSTITKMNAQATQENQLAEAKQRTDAVIAKTTPGINKAKTEQSLEKKSLTRMYQIKHPTAVREEPNFESPALGKFAAGTKVKVVAARGDWFEVRADDTGLAGFIRREFVTTVELTQKSKGLSSQ
ncbi:MAG TPA: AgmX/PglI C-terminal domain-containing protein [Candidatus Binatia bacterium]|nr:AgmX/PglI C-terminal domain-containing protein [Candidatus Binatia bacterium]